MAQSTELTHQDIEFLLVALKSHQNLHGAHIEQAVSTIKKLQEKYDKKKREINEIYRR